MTPEAKVKRMVKEKMREIFPDAWEYMPAAGAYGKNGAPDFLYCINGLMVGIECKSGPGRWPTGLQAMQLEKIRKAGGVAALVYDTQTLMECVMHIGVRLGLDITGES